MQALELQFRLDEFRLGGGNGDVRITGRLDASGAEGGTVNVTGRHIEIDGTATIHADAATNGHGGLIDLVAAQDMNFAGMLTARGGTLSGNGGRAEISGYETLGFNGLVDMSATQGQRGSLLLDPAFSVIYSGKAPSGVLQKYVISATALSFSLALVDVILQADDFIDVGTRADGYAGLSITGDPVADALITAGLDGLSDGAIDLGSWKLLALQDTTAGSLTLQSDKVNFNRALTMGNGDLNVRAGAGGINWNADVTMKGGGAINAVSDGVQKIQSTLDTKGGMIALTNYGTRHGEGIQISDGGALLSGGGDITIDTNGTAGKATGGSLITAGVIDARGAGTVGDVHITTRQLQLNGDSGIYADTLNVDGALVMQGVNGVVDVTRLTGKLASHVTLQGKNNRIASIGNLTTGLHGSLGGAVTIANARDLAIDGTILTTADNVQMTVDGNVTVGAGGNINATGGNIAIAQTGIFSSPADRLKISATGTIDIEQRAGGSLDNAVNAFDNSGTGLNTLLVHEGTYTENITIRDSYVRMISEKGRDATIIDGQSYAGALGTVLAIDGVNHLQIGDTGQGFTILGIDNDNPASENAALYFQRGHDTVTIRGNHITARGDEALATEYGHANKNFTIDDNIFDGKTYEGASWAVLSGAQTQWNTKNVARQLVVLNRGHENLIFTNNTISGDAGSNRLVSIESAGALVDGNMFDGAGRRGGMLLQGSAITVTDNAMTGKGFGNGIWAYDVNGLTIGGATAGLKNTVKGYQNGIQITGGTGVTLVQGNDVTGNLDTAGRNASNWTTGIGIVLNDVTSAHIVDNDVTGNDDGIRVIDSKAATAGDILVEANGTLNNKDKGIILKNSENISVVANIMTGNDFGLYADGSKSALIQANSINNNKTDGIRLRASSGAQILNNVIAANNGAGIFVDNALGGTANVRIFDNSVTASTGKLVENKNTAIVDASGNWWGSTGESYINGKMTGNVDFSPYQATGIDSDTGARGYQGDFSHLYATTLGQQSGLSGRVQEAINLIQDGTKNGGARLVNLNSGTYNETGIAVNKALTIDGVNTTDATKAVIKGAGDGHGLTLAADNITLRYFTVDGHEQGIRVNTAIDKLFMRNINLRNNTKFGMNVAKDGVLDDMKMRNVRFNNNTDIGFRVSGAINDLDMHGGTVTGSRLGIAILFEGNGPDGTYLTNARFNDITFNHNQEKAFYAEKLSDTKLSLLDIRNTGTGGDWPAGIDINLKYGDYQNLLLDQTKIWMGSVPLAGRPAIAVKARDDGSYAGNPASLTGLVITRSDIDITNGDAIVVGDDVTDVKIVDNNKINGGRGIVVYGGVDEVLIADNTLSTTGAGIVVDGTAGLDVVRNGITGGTLGINLINVTDALVGGKHADANVIGDIANGWGNAGIRIKDGAAITVSHNELTAIGGQGIQIEGTWGMAETSLLVADNRITGVTHNALSLAHWNGATLRGNVIDVTSVGNGIMLDLGRNTQLIDNVISNVKNNGIHLNRGNRVTTITGNKISGAKNGIVLDAVGNDLNADTTIGSAAMEAGKANVIRDSAKNGIVINGSNGVALYGNDVNNNSFGYGLYASGTQNGALILAGNKFTHNAAATKFESGIVDLTGAANEFTGGHGLIFMPLAADKLALVNDTIGGSIFDIDSGHFVMLTRGAFFAPGKPTVIDATHARFNGISAADYPGFVLSQADYDMIEHDRVWHYRDDPTLGLLDFGIRYEPPAVTGETGAPAADSNAGDGAPLVDQNRIIPNFIASSLQATGLNVTITGLPATGLPAPSMTPQGLSAIIPFAGTAEELSEIAPAAGGDMTAPIPAPSLSEDTQFSCWGDATGQAQQGYSVTISYSMAPEDMLDAASACNSAI